MKSYYITLREFTFIIPITNHNKKYNQIKKITLKRNKTINKSYQGRFLSPTYYKT